MDTSTINIMQVASSTADIINPLIPLFIEILGAVIALFALGMIYRAIVKSGRIVTR